MIKPYFIFINKILILNFLVSLFATYLAANLIPNGFTLSSIIKYFLISFLTGGYLSGVLYYEIFRNKEYYFFYNLGITRLRLILTSYLFHLIIAFPLFIISLYAQHS